VTCLIRAWLGVRVCVCVCLHVCECVCVFACMYVSVGVNLLVHVLQQTGLVSEAFIFLV